MTYPSKAWPPKPEGAESANADTGGGAAGTSVRWRCPCGSRHWLALHRRGPGPCRLSRTAGGVPGLAALPTPSQPGPRPSRTTLADPGPAGHPACGLVPAAALSAWPAARHHARQQRWRASAWPRAARHGPPRGGDSSAAWPPARWLPDRHRRTGLVQISRPGTARAQPPAGTPPCRYHCRWPGIPPGQ